MADIDLTQVEADTLIVMDKECVSEEVFEFPQPGGRLVLPLRSADRREAFLLDVTRSSIKLTKGNLQTRARQTTVLLRLDVDGAPHRNPDGVEISCPHLHIYREGYGYKWAYEVPPELLAGDGKLYALLHRFMTYCRVTLPPNIQEGLF